MTGLHDEPIEVTMSRITREALAKVQTKIAAGQMGEAFAGLDDRRHGTTLPRGPERREDQDETQQDIDWYALSNGLSTVMPDGTLIQGSDDD
jgi:hypothetical protein